MKRLAVDASIDNKTRPDKLNKWVGVDGCRAGWVAACLHDDHLDIEVFPDIASLWQAHADAAMILVDMPIGLPSDQPRRVDAAARKRLPGKGASVFPVPCREAVYAADYAAACDINQACFGKRLSKQVWHICPKIRQLDELLRRDPGAADSFREAHPELAFALYNGGVPLAPPKRSGLGQQQRLMLIQRDLPGAGSVVDAARDRWLRRALQTDDLLDALVLVQTLVNGHQTLLSTDQQDAAGLQVNLMIPRYSAVAMFP